MWILFWSGLIEHVSGLLPLLEHLRVYNDYANVSTVHWGDFKTCSTEATPGTDVMPYDT